MAISPLVLLVLACILLVSRVTPALEADSFRVSVRLDNTALNRGFNYVLALSNGTTWVRERAADNSLKIRRYPGSYATGYSHNSSVPVSSQPLCNT